MNTATLLAYAMIATMGSSVVLGVFMALQAYLDRQRRTAYVLLAVVWWGRATLDLAKILDGLLDASYHTARLGWIGLYAGSVLLLLGLGWRLSTVASLLVWVVSGALLYAAIAPGVAVVVVFPLAFGIAALGHAVELIRHRGFASCVLTAFTAAQAIMCTQYGKVLQRADAEYPDLIWQGFWHMALAMTILALFGWIQLPRELDGRAPVRVTPRHAWLFLIVVLAAEVAVNAGMLGYDAPGATPFWYAGGTALQIAALLLLYFHHAHELVIHTDDVARLLDERTASLEQARQQLAAANEVQAAELKAQAIELQTKAAVIDRQRRLELAAQTAGGAAHDIHNLLTPIMVGVDRLTRANEADLSRDLALRLRRQLGQLSELNAQLLALSRRGRIERAPVELAELLGQLREQFEGAEIQIECDAELWTLGSFAQLLRALANLVRNALEASDGAPVQLKARRVTVRQTRPCHLGFLQPGEFVRVEVRDQGGGIPPELRDVIFEPFSTAKSTRGGSGSGLGLTIVAAVVDDHGGVLDLHSGPEGTRFELYLPPAEPPSDWQDLDALRGDEAILIVDDDAAVRQHYGQLLEEAGYYVLCADDGAEGIRLLQEEAVDLMLLDLRMPVIGGFETFFAAINLRPGVRAVIHTSYADDEDAARLTQLGADAILTKPAGRRELLSTLRSVLDVQQRGEPVGGTR